MVELQFDVKKQNIQAIEENHNRFECERLAVQGKEKAFGMISSVKKFFSGKDEIHLVSSEKRYEPFWHICGNSELEYKRKTEYEFPIKPEVKTVKIANTVCKTEENKCRIVGEDHCFENIEKELFVDAYNGDNKDFSKYIEEKSRQIKETEELMKTAIVIPAKIKASSLVRQLIKDLIKPIEADKIIKEKAMVSKLALYFRPIYAFEFVHGKSGKKQILEVDAVNGEVKKGSIVGKGMGEIFSEGDLFEIGTEFVTDFIPGVKAGVMVAQKIKAAHKKKKARAEENKQMIKRLHAGA